MTLYFDPLTILGEESRTAFRGRWEDRNRLDVPGPFYGGGTDTCWTGRLHAPRHVLYGGPHLTEYVYRQPRTPTETARLAEAAAEDPFQGYGCDGDARWTPATVREWWHDRGHVTRYLSGMRSEWEAMDAARSQGLAAAARDFAAYLAGDLAQDLRVYLYWLEERRSPGPDDRLPEL
ncbi:ferredoxin [Streptomyces sp. UNOC14_S4]|uniref:ferredoxin n=1 Tax=Streptomyces sp. UNOC14_S4 TaxID=2872340 RepID=UPI001E3075A6|nr:ferredoxin [Streptomyces sp. UNOC14_S4]MCC3768937.1 ferredoxin [Streptomyces sp. UNOC14_S4]